MIDFHLHLGHRGRTLDDLLRHLDNLGVERCVLLPVENDDPGRDPQFSTEHALAAAEQYPDRIVPFCHVDPASEGAAERVRRYAESGARGFGEHKVKRPVDDPRSMGIYALCGELGLPVLIHFQDWDEGYNTNFPAFEGVLQELPDVTFIGHAQTFWGHIGQMPARGDAYPKGPITERGLTDLWMEQYPNLWGDLSAGSGLNALTRDPEFTKGFLARHWRRLLWATDCPCRDGKGAGFEAGCFAPKSLDALKRSAPSEEAFQAITHGNAARLLDATG